MTAGFPQLEEFTVASGKSCCRVCGRLVPKGERLYVRASAAFMTEHDALSPTGIRVCAECAWVPDVPEGGEPGWYPDEDVTDDVVCTLDTRAIRLLPHGKSSKDKCPNCFIIHATTQRECE